MSNRLPKRLIAFVLAPLLALPAAATPHQKEAQPPQPTVQEPAPSSPLPGSEPQIQQEELAQSTADSGQSGGHAGTAAPAVGTAAAPYEKASGVTASRPAGAVIAPAKQHRVRRIFIRVGILAAAGAALGAVAVLSHASPSRPN